MDSAMLDLTQFSSELYFSLSNGPSRILNTVKGVTEKKIRYLDKQQRQSFCLWQKAGLCDE